MKIKNYDFLQVPNSFLQGEASKKMDHIEILIYLYLATFCFGDKTSCFPTQERIAIDLGLALSTVKQKIKFMVQRRVIIITGKSRGGRAKWNTYELTPWEEIHFLDDWFNIRAETKKMNTSRSSDEQPHGGLFSEDEADQPLEGSPDGLSKDHQSAINNNKSITISNNKILASGDADIFYSLSNDKDKSFLPKKEFNKDSKRETVPSTGRNSYNDRNKPRDISKMYHPSASLKEIKDKTYFFFKINGFDVQGHAQKLYDLPDKELSNLITGYSYLDYWKDYQYGDNSLTMYIRNLLHFIANVEGDRFYSERQWEEDNNQLLVDEYILKNNVFDIRSKENQERIQLITKKHGEIDTGNRLQTSWINCSSDSIKYCAGHLVSNGDAIAHKLVGIISIEVVQKVLEQYEKQSPFVSSSIVTT